MHTLDSVKSTYNLPINTLIYKAQETLHRFHNPTQIELHTLCSVKTGGCSENCAYCSQSSHHNTFLQASSFLSVDEIVEKAKISRDAGAMRFSLSCAWKTIPSETHMQTLISAIKAVKDLGLQVCCTLGMLSLKQAQQLKEAGCDCYNHNIDTSRNYYKKIVSTHTFDDRLLTIKNVRKAGIMVCSGGIIGMGESIDDRLLMLIELANMNPQPDSVPINALVSIEGTSLQPQPFIDSIDFVRIIAAARIILPKATIHLAAGRHKFSEEMQTLCFLAGANGFHFGEKLLTTPNNDTSADLSLLQKLGLHPSPLPASCLT